MAEDKEINQIVDEATALADDDYLYTEVNLGGSRYLSKKVKASNLPTNDIAETQTDTTGIVSAFQSQVNIEPSDESSTVNIAVLGRIDFTNSGGKAIVNGGHQGAVVGLVSNNSSTTNPLGIGVEGKFENESGTVTNGVPVEAQISKNAAGATITNGFLVDASVTSNAGTIAGLAAVAMQVSGNTGNINAAYGLLMTNLGALGASSGSGKTIIGVYFPDQTNNSNATRYAFLCLDAGAPIATAGEIHAKNLIQQIVDTPTAATSSGTTLIPLDTSIPTYAEGDQYMTATITPKDASNILYIEWELIFSTAVAHSVTVALFQDGTGTDAAIHAKAEYLNANLLHVVKGRHKMTAGGTSSTTFQIRAGMDSGSDTLYFNSLNGTQPFGGVSYSSLKITEHRP